MRYGYARVSTEEQSLARQRSALDAAGCDQIIEAVQSGVKARHRLDDRPGSGSVRRVGTSGRRLGRWVFGAGLTWQEISHVFHAWNT